MTAQVLPLRPKFRDVAAALRWHDQRGTIQAEVRFDPAPCDITGDEDIDALLSTVFQLLLALRHPHAPNKTLRDRIELLGRLACDEGLSASNCEHAAHRGHRDMAAAAEKHRRRQMILNAWSTRIGEQILAPSIGSGGAA